MTIAWIESERKVLFAIQSKTKAIKNLGNNWLGSRDGNFYNVQEVGVIILPESVENDNDFYRKKEKALLKLVEAVKGLMGD